MNTPRLHKERIHIYTPTHANKIFVILYFSFSFFIFFLFLDMSNQESEYVKLISSDGFEFIIHREAAIRSGTIKNMLSGPGIVFGYGVVRHAFVTVASSI